MFARIHTWLSKGSWLALHGALMIPGCGDEASQGTQMKASFELEENECGAGLVDAPNEIGFGVSVSIGEGELDWAMESGKVLTGTTSDDSFSMTDSYTSDQGNGCIIEVTSRYEGTFDEKNGSVRNMSGDYTIRYDEYEPIGACAPLIDPSSGFEKLPCEVSYSFDLGVVN